MSRRAKRYAVSDSAQQVTGGFLLAGPFVVTEEVWVLAADMNSIHALITVAIVFVVGYAALYKADAGRDPDREAEIGGVPTRFVSLMLVSFGSVALLAMSFGAPGTFLDTANTATAALTTAKAVSVGSVFSVIGAATADSLF